MPLCLGLVTLQLDFVNPDVPLRGCSRRVTRWALQTSRQGLEEGSVSSWLRAWIGSTARNRSVWPWQSRMTIWAHSSISKIRVKCPTLSPAPSPSHLCFQILFSFYHLSPRWRFVLLWISPTRMLLWESGIWFFFFFFFVALFQQPEPNRWNICRMKGWVY